MRGKIRVNAFVIWLVLGGAALMVLGAVLIGVTTEVSSRPETLHYFSMEFLQRAAEYEQASLFLYLTRQMVILLFFTAAAVWSAHYFQGIPRVPPGTAAGYIAVFVICLYLLTLPLDFYRGFIVEHGFGLSSQTAGSWFIDYIKSGLISLVITTAGLTGLYYLMLNWTHRWWFLAGVGFSIFVLLSSYLFPVIIDPLFHRFTPLEDEALNSEILALADRAGIEVDQVLVADASQRTQKANAYFTGIGSTKRIVIYDNLLEKFSPREVLVVIAHEMGHWKHAHIAKGIALTIITTFISMFFFHKTLKIMGTGFNLHLIPLFVLFFTLLSLVLMPAQNTISREFERQADRKAIILTEDTEAFISVKQNLAKTNLGTVQPHPLVRAVLYSHPPIIERIGTARQVRTGE